MLLMRQSSFDDCDYLSGNLKVVFSNLDSPLGSFNGRWSREHFKVFLFLMLQLWLNIDHLHKWDTCSVGSCTGVEYCLHRGLNIVWLIHGKTQEGLWFDAEESVGVEENCFAVASRHAVGGALVDKLLNLTENLKWWTCSSGSECNPAPPKVSPHGAQKDTNYVEMRALLQSHRCFSMFKAEW